MNMQQNARLRSIVYIDGFNLYYGALKNTAHKWLDIQKLFQRLLPNDDIEQIYYFTAKVSGNAGRSPESSYSFLAREFPSMYQLQIQYVELQLN